MFHILNPFPDLLNYSLFAPIFLRLALSYVFFSFATSIFKKNPENINSPTASEEIGVRWKIWGIAEFVLALAFFFGFGVQIASMISAFYAFVLFFFHTQVTIPQKETRLFYLLLLFVSLSLLVSGAGVLAIDWPL